MKYWGRSICVQPPPGPGSVEQLGLSTSSRYGDIHKELSPKFRESLHNNWKRPLLGPLKAPISTFIFKNLFKQVGLTLG